MVYQHLVHKQQIQWFPLSLRFRTKTERNQYINANLAMEISVWVPTVLHALASFHVADVTQQHPALPIGIRMQMETSGINGITQDQADAVGLPLSQNPSDCLVDTMILISVFSSHSSMSSDVSISSHAAWNLKAWLCGQPNSHLYIGALEVVFLLILSTLLREESSK